MLFFFNEQEATDSFSLNFKIKKITYYDSASTIVWAHISETSVRCEHHRRGASIGHTTLHLLREARHPHCQVPSPTKAKLVQCYTQYLREDRAPQYFL